MIRMLRALANYVELNCKDDMNVFLSSGFQPRTRTRSQAQPLDQPMILYIGPPGSSAHTLTPNAATS